MFFHLRVVFFCFLFCLCGRDFLDAVPAVSPVQVEIVAEEETIVPGRPFWVALHFKIEPDWHLYWKNPGEVGAPPKVEWQFPEGFAQGTLSWPYPEKMESEGLVTFGYEKEVTLLVEIIPPSALPDKEFSLKGELNWLVCSNSTCQPGALPFSLKIQGNKIIKETKEEHLSYFENSRKKIPLFNEQIQVNYEKGHVQIEWPFSKEDHYEEVTFFPEIPDTLASNHSSEIALVDDRYILRLKAHENIEQKNTLFKGVLVLKNQQTTKAFEIEHLLMTEKEEGLLSFLESVDHKILPEKPSVFEGGLSLALLFAFLGGMLLNLMPCVLPVISFKVMSFVKMSGESRSTSLKHGLMFSAGVLVSFWILASVMLILRSYGQAVGWGFQLQEPLFVIILASLLFVFALSLFGLFEIGLFVSSLAGQQQIRSSQSETSKLVSSFFSGVLATAVATPCTGPFLGSAVGFAVTLPFMQALSIFTSLAIGMSFPYLILAAYPSLLRFIPKPGPWMETFKQLMGFILLATVLWLLWVFSAQTSSLALLAVLAGFLCFSVAAWIYGRASYGIKSRLRLWSSYALIALMVFSGCKIILYPSESWGQTTESNEGEWKGWHNFSPEVVEQLKKENKPLFIDFTAKWCLICQLNHAVLASEKVENAFAELGVTKIKADWTKSDPKITEALSRLGRNSVPLYVLYNGQDDEPIILPQVLTADIVLEHLEQLKNEG